MKNESNNTLLVPPGPLLAAVPTPPAPPINPAWQECVDALGTEALQRLVVWRGCAFEFFLKLKELLLIGLCNGRIAFPIIDPKGEVVGCHNRSLAEDGGWRVTGFNGFTAPLFPFIINDPLTKECVAVFESQWDMFAFLDKGDWHNGGLSEFGAITTRGASFRTEYLKGRWGPKSVVLTFGQNDNAGRAWFNRIVKAAPGVVFKVHVPDGHKDLNDWTRSGATWKDIEAAVGAEPVKQQLPSGVALPVDEGVADSDIDSGYDGNKQTYTTKDGRVLVRLPCRNRLMSEFASDLGQALADHELYNRNGLPFLVDQRQRSLKHMTADIFRTWSERCAVCFNLDKPKEGPPAIIRKTMSSTEATAVLASPQFLNRLSAIRKLNQVRLPVLRNSGVIELLPIGYDSESQTFTFDSPGLDCSNHMTLDAAKSVLSGLFEEFCFRPDGGRSLSVAIAGMMTLFAIGLLPEGAMVPCFIVMANAEGAGKTSLVKVQVFRCSAISLPVQSQPLKRK